MPFKVATGSFRCPLSTLLRSWVQSCLLGGVLPLLLQEVQRIKSGATIESQLARAEATYKSEDAAMQAMPPPACCLLAAPAPAA